MTSRSLLDNPLHLWAIGAALVSAVAFVILLAKLSTPHDLRERLTAAGSKLDQAADVTRRTKRLVGGELSSVCAMPPTEYAGLLRKSLNEAVGRTGVKLSGLEVRPVPSQNANSLVSPIRVRLQTVGSYDGTLNLIDSLGKQGPEFYVDTVDMKSSASTVSMVFVGRVFCAS